MTDYAISDVARDSRHDGFGGSESGWRAIVTLADGSTVHVSQLDGEAYWVADALFGGNGYPHWCHGFGVRYVACRTVADDLSSELDVAVRLAGGASS